MLITTPTTTLTTCTVVAIKSITGFGSMAGDPGLEGGRGARRTRRTLADGSRARRMGHDECCAAAVAQAHPRSHCEGGVGSAPFDAPRPPSSRPINSGYRRRRHRSSYLVMSALGRVDPAAAI